MPDVFISYSRKDAQIAQQLASKLQANDVSVFIDQTSLVAGESLEASLTRSIDRAQAVIVILSGDVRSRFVEKELTQALEMQKEVIPVLYGPEARENWIWPLVADRRPVTIESTGDLQKVVERVKSSLGVRQPDRKKSWSVAIPMVAGLVAVIAATGRDAVQACLWAVACASVGGLFGFLFGIPRIPGKTARGTNTNLEQISDWLTKILIGAALVQLSEIKALIASLASTVATSLSRTSASYAMAVALIAYFTVVGFVIAYLVTRWYLTLSIDGRNVLSTDVQVEAGSQHRLEP